jgi:hypothetical protein
MNLKMGDGEKLSNYHRRFSAALASLVENASRVSKIEVVSFKSESGAYAGAHTEEVDPHPAGVPSDSMQAVHFISTLSSQYGQYKINFMRGVMAKPASLQAAYEAVVQFGPDRLSLGAVEIDATEKPYQKNIFAFSKRGGRGDRRGGGRGNGRVSSKGRGACAYCKKDGHWKAECPDNHDAINAIINSNVKSSKQSN